MKKDFLSIKLTLGSYGNFVSEIVNLAKAKTSAYVCVANVHMLVEAFQNKVFGNIVCNADITTPDGMPLVVALKWLYGIKQDRVAGMDLLPSLLEEAENQQLPIFFYGGTDEMIASTAIYISKHYPALSNIGYYSPPFRPLTIEEEQAVISKINHSGAGMVFVILGCPKQEKWMASMRGKINAVMVGIGGALPVMIGLQKRAPEWMQRNSLEWLYRLSQEPKRLFKRYFVTNSVFIFLVLKEKLRLFFIKKQ
ncbi:WecB/TagA/CpsF family glycosyltransferase [Parasediminibacterium sp. JCM 36343]|uniref:WecB/TagA/CpsF family glycosyltransferase n=1 Tax=Parasediminibacterium sp. JCM 36343 TaxID=3374279 RepID=UPI00397DBC3B